MIDNTLIQDPGVVHRGRAVLLAGAAGLLLLLLSYFARTWSSLADAVAVCPMQFCDFVDYYYPMGRAVFHADAPIEGFLYSPFIAVLLAPLARFGLDTALVLWGILQVVFIALYVLLFRRLVSARLSILVLFAALTVFSYPPLLNLMGGSVSFFMVVAIFGVVAAAGRGRRLVAAILLAVAVSFKFYPLIFVAPFIARRDMRFLLLAVVAGAAVLFVVPGLFLGPGDTLRFYSGLAGAFRDSSWVEANVHSQHFPHVALRMASGLGGSAVAIFPLLRAISFGVAAANLGLLFLVQRARLRHADLWSFQILFLTLPFVLKTAWPHDFVFLSFTQAFLVWWLRGGGKPAGARKGLPLILVLVSIVMSNTAFFALFTNFELYGYGAFPFWSALSLLIAAYLVLWPAVTRGLPRRSEEG